jgi:dGTPase
MMNWEQLLSLNVKATRQTIVEQDDTRLGFEVDYDRIIFFLAAFYKDKTQVIPLSKTILCTRLTHSLEVSVVGALWVDWSEKNHRNII